MFRVSACVFTFRSLLARRQPVDCIASFTRFPSNNAIYNPRQRQACPPPPPPPPKPPKDDSLFWGTVAVLFLAGAGLVSAKHSPEIRDWLSVYAPWADDLIAYFYEENMTYGELANQCIKYAKEYIMSLTEEKEAPKPCSLNAPTNPPIEEAPPPPTDDEEDEEEDDDEGEKCVPEPTPVVTQSICEIEACLKELGEFIVNNYWTAKQASAYYNSLVDETMVNFSYNKLKKLHDAMKERKDLVKESLKNVTYATRRQDDMIKYLDCGGVQAKKEEIDNAKLLHKNNGVLARASCMQYKWENDKSNSKDRQWEIVEEIVDRYVSEKTAMYPGLKYTDENLAIKEADPDLLFYGTLRYIKQLNQEVKDAQQTLSERVNRAYDLLPKGEKEEKNRANVLKAAVAKRSAEIDKDLKDLAQQQKERNERELKALLKKQKDDHEANMALKLIEKEKETQAKFDKMVAEQVKAEKNVFAIQLADMAMKLSAVEEKLNVRLKAERETKRSQELWAAGASLLAATRKGGQFINVNKELNAIEKASDGTDQLVLTVLKAIPPSVREQGLVPETVLKEKYKVMESVALKVSLVEEDGGPMPVYVLSWLQAFLLFMKVSGIPQDEFDKPPQEPAKELDTFDLLQRARFWMERGNLAAALRYVNHLQGASRLAAHQWYEAARAHLEVRQAAEAVLAHAASIGLQYI